jgi:hypothetical protein
MRRSRLGIISAVLAGSCATGPAVSPALPVPGAALDVETVPADLQVTPLEVAFYGVRGLKPTEETVVFRNNGNAPVELVRLEMVGHDAELFRVVHPQLPFILPPGGKVSAAVGFAPPADDAPGVRRAILRVRTGGRAQVGPPVDISGLVVPGPRADQEPPLAQVLDALGFPVDTGASRLRLGTGRSPIGTEVRGARFRRAQPGAVALYPVARFSSNQRVLYGIYTGVTSPRKQLLAHVAAWQGQTLNPDLEPRGGTTFDPGDEPFGIFETTEGRTQHSDDLLNSGRHAARVYPLANRSGGHIQDAYVVAFDEDGDGDYQDCVFVIQNVVPVA